jgi:hypothetical protein
MIKEEIDFTCILLNYTNADSFSNSIAKLHSQRIISIGDVHGSYNMMAF